MLERLDVDLVLDVGAGSGTYGRWLRRQGYRGRIISYEPQGPSYARLVASAANDRLWDCHQMAVGARMCQGILNLSDNPNFTSLRTRQSSHALFAKELAIRGYLPVTVMRLDEHLPTTTAVDGRRVYLKTDTQGYDMEVISGAAGLLDQVFAIQLEVAMVHLYEDVPSLSEVMCELTKLDFAASGFFPVTLTQELVAIELDLIAVRNQSLNYL